jgi:hypothetical protein
LISRSPSVRLLKPVAATLAPLSMAQAPGSAGRVTSSKWSPSRFRAFRELVPLARGRVDRPSADG